MKSDIQRLSDYMTRMQSERRKVEPQGKAQIIHEIILETLAQNVPSWLKMSTAEAQAVNIWKEIPLQGHNGLPSFIVSGSQTISEVDIALATDERFVFVEVKGESEYAHDKNARKGKSTLRRAYNFARKFFGVHPLLLLAFGSVNADDGIVIVEDVSCVSPYPLFEPRRSEKLVLSVDGCDVPLPQEQKPPPPTAKELVKTLPVNLWTKHPLPWRSLDRRLNHKTYYDDNGIEVCCAYFSEVEDNIAWNTYYRQVLQSSKTSREDRQP